MYHLNCDKQWRLFFYNVQNREKKIKKKNHQQPENKTKKVTEGQQTGQRIKKRWRGKVKEKKNYKKRCA